MTNEEKVKKVIDLYSKNYEVDEVARAVGYSHPKSLSRFMGDMSYKWDNVKKNYVPRVGEKAAVKKKNINTKQMITSKKNNVNVDPLDLLEDDRVITLLQQSDRLLGLLQPSGLAPPTNQTNRPQYSFWRKAQEFAFARKANYTTSVRLPVDLHDRFKDFCTKTNLSQTQLICMSIDYFIEKFESKVSQ
ncbi:hypothetical protein [Cytobacillus sp. Bac17]|uniref:hypothetical protein n=1 Tax=Cytobacillus sp. Bac17 TaxID=2926008 RepID=UPI00211779B7|nr:hypothetical protein [Cytobacillus sp. Bac17]